MRIKSQINSAVLSPQNKSICQVGSPELGTFPEINYILNMILPAASKANCCSVCVRKI